MRAGRQFTFLTMVFSIAAIPQNLTHAQEPVHYSGDLTLEGNLHLPNFNLLSGGVLEFPGKLLVKRGGDGQGFPPVNGKTRAQPGGNLEIQPLGDYSRSALDIYPTTGKRPEFDALAELTIHRIHPSNQGHEMLSVTALSDSQQRFGVIVEAHGKGRIKPLDFQMIQGGLLEVDKNIKPFDAIAMRVKTDGTTQFSVQRNGGTPGPVDAISLERDNPGSAGEFPSDYVRWTAKRAGEHQQQSDWRANVQFSSTHGTNLVVENREDAAAYQEKMKLASSGELELPMPAAGVILTSPNGKKWHLSVTNEGELKVDAWEPK